MPLKSGDKAPAFTLLDQSGEKVKLSDFKGRKVLVYFYPKADTPGCTTQACGIRDHSADYEAAGAVVLGVSPDSEASHAKFKEKYGLPFTLLADADHSVSDRYAHTRQLVDPAGRFRAVFQSNSWGGGLTTSYTGVSAAMDDIVFDHDILICQSQSNAGSRRSRPQAWAKNVLSVGGQFHFNTLDRGDDRWNGGASIGPAADGRIKPDLSNYYDRIHTTSSATHGRLAITSRSRISRWPCGGER